MRKTKIIATLGPASDTEEIMTEMLRAGMNVARINFSHGTHEEQLQKINAFKAVREKLRVSAAILLDTKGPEIRVMDFKNGSEELKNGEEFILTTRETIGTSREVQVTYKDFHKDVKPGTLVLINDGKIILTVVEIKDKDVICKVVHGGRISNHKGINVPNAHIDMDYISVQDREDILFGIKNDVDYIAASFVRTADDVVELKKILSEHDADRIKVISKIESTEGVKNFDEILKVSDGIMIARGDMGVELAYERLPGIQKDFIKRCLLAGKPVITATQMLESMVESPMPTRAEITDVANAVFDGSGAVMLSGETAAGKNPVEAVATMAKIAEQAERDMSLLMRRNYSDGKADERDVTSAIAHAACTLSEDIQAGAIVAMTKSGFTAERVSKFRPNIQIIGASPYKKTFMQLSLIWGVAPMLVDYNEDIDESIKDFCRKSIEEGLVNNGDKLVMTAGLPVDIRGNTNLIKVVTAE